LFIAVSAVLSNKATSLSPEDGARDYLKNATITPYPPIISKARNILEQNAIIFKQPLYPDKSTGKYLKISDIRGRKSK
jgi:hypothetical protein